MNSTNDGKEVKNFESSGPKGKTFYIELYKSLESRLTQELVLRERTECLKSAWQQIHTLCLHSAPNTHPHLLNWLQRHTSKTVLQTEWQSPGSKEIHSVLEDGINSFIRECETAVASRLGKCLSWEAQLLQRASWFISMLGNPWGHPVLRKMLDPRGSKPSDDEVLEWLKEERGVMFVTRLRQLTASKCDDLALALASSIMDRVRAGTHLVPDNEQTNEQPVTQNTEPTLADILTKEAGFNMDVWELLTDIEFVLLHKSDKRSHCIDLAKQTPLRDGYQLVERLQSRLETSPKEKKLWKNAKEVATLIAQVIIARCMVTKSCTGVARIALYCCARSLAKLVPAGKLPATAAVLAAPAVTAKHVHTLASAARAQLHAEVARIPFICELYVRAITAGMNELERLKVETAKESEARAHEQMLATWFCQLGNLLCTSDRIKCECLLTAFSVHPAPEMYERIQALPQVQSYKEQTQKDNQETTSEFGSWANDSRSQTNLVKTSETLKMNQTLSQKNVLSVAMLNEGEAVGLDPELCQDLAVLLSGPRLKTLSWDMDREELLKTCRIYMDRTGGGTRALTTELKYLNLDPNSYQHLPEEDDNVDDVYYGIEKGYEHLVEFEEAEPEEIWEDAIFSETESEQRSDSSNKTVISKTKRKPKKKHKKIIIESSDSEIDPLSLADEVRESQKTDTQKEKKKERPHSKERSRGKKKPQTKVKNQLEKSNNRAPSKEEKEPTQRKGNKERSQNKEKSKDSSQSKERKKEKRKEKKERKKQQVSDNNQLYNVISTNVPKMEPNKTLSSPNDLPSKPISLSTSMSQSTASTTDSMPVASLNPAGFNQAFLAHIQNSVGNIPSQIASERQSHGYHDNKPSKKHSAPVRRVRTMQTQVKNVVGKLHQNSQVSTVKNVSYPRASPTSNSPKPTPALEFATKIAISDNVKQSITKLIQFRKPKPESPSTVTSFSNVNTTPCNSSPKVLDKSTNREERIQSLREQMNFLLKAKSANVDQLSNKNYQLGTYHGSHKIYSSPKIVHQSPPYTNTDINQQLTKNDTLSRVPSTQDCFEQFIKTLQQQKLYEQAKSVSTFKYNPKKTLTTSTVSATSQTSKQVTQSKKMENAPNTFARLSYMHKTKQEQAKISSTESLPSASTSIIQHTSNLNQLMHEQKKLKAKIKDFNNFNKTVDTSPQPSTKNISKMRSFRKSNDNIVNDPMNTVQCSKSSRNEIAFKPQRLIEEVNSSSKASPSGNLTLKDQAELLLLLQQQNKLNNVRNPALNKSNTALSSCSSTVTPSQSNIQKILPTQISQMTSNLQSEGQQKSTITSTTCPNNNVQNQNMKVGYKVKNKSKVLAQPIPIQKSTTNEANSIIRSKLISPTLLEKKGLAHHKSLAESEKKLQRHASRQKDRSEDSSHARSTYKSKPGEKQDWESVMNLLLAQKTPVRKLNATLDENSSKNKSTKELKVAKSEIDTPLSIKSTVRSPQLKSNDYSTFSKPKEISPALNVEKIVAKNVYQKKVKVESIPVPKPTICSIDPSFSYQLSKEEDPFISGIPNSDYDLLEELMDDELRKEIGELSSDEEASQALNKNTVKTKETTVVSKQLKISVVNKPTPTPDIISKKQTTEKQHNIEKPQIENKDHLQTSEKQSTKTSRSVPSNSNVNVSFISPHEILQTPEKIRVSDPTIANIPGPVNTANYILAQQHPQVQNMYLIGADVVYDPFSSIQLPNTNTGTNTLIAVNKPTLGLYSMSEVVTPTVNPALVQHNLTLPVQQSMPFNTMERITNTENQTTSCAVNQRTITTPIQKTSTFLPENHFNTKIDKECKYVKNALVHNNATPNTTNKAKCVSIDENQDIQTQSIINNQPENQRKSIVNQSMNHHSLVGQVVQAPFDGNIMVQKPPNNAVDRTILNTSNERNDKGQTNPLEQKCQKQKPTKQQNTQRAKQSLDGETKLGATERISDSPLQNKILPKSDSVKYPNNAMRSTNIKCSITQNQSEPGTLRSNPNKQEIDKIQLKTHVQEKPKKVDSKNVQKIINIDQMKIQQTKICDEVFSTNTKSKVLALKEPNPKETKSTIDNALPKQIERKVLSQVQEKFTSMSDNLESKVLKSAVSCAHKNQERLMQKRLAIMNRQITHQSYFPSIPLTYTPLNKNCILLKPPTVPDANDDLNKNQAVTFETKEDEQCVGIDYVLTPDSQDDVENKSLDNINDNSDDKLQCRRILLRSSNKHIEKISLHIPKKNKKLKSVNKSEVKVTPAKKRTTPSKRNSKRLQGLRDEVQRNTVSDSENAKFISTTNNSEVACEKSYLNTKQLENLGVKSTSSISEDSFSIAHAERCLRSRSQGEISYASLNKHASEEEKKSINLPSKSELDKNLENPDKGSLNPESEITFPEVNSTEKHDAQSKVRSDLQLGQKIPNSSKFFNEKRAQTVLCEESLVPSGASITTTEKVMQISNSNIKDNDRSLPKILRSNNQKKSIPSFKNFDDKKKKTKSKVLTKIDDTYNDKSVVNVSIINKSEIPQNSHQSSNSDQSNDKHVRKSNDLASGGVSAKLENPDVVAHHCITLNTEKIMPTSKKLGAKSNSAIPTVHEETPEVEIDNLLTLIKVMEIPSNSADPNVRCARVYMPNNKAFKVTITGGRSVTYQTIFENPDIRSYMMNCLEDDKQKCTMLVKNYELSLKAAPKNIETIDLLSDEEDKKNREEDRENIQNIVTEYGTYRVKNIPSGIYDEHQARIRQRCTVLISDCNIKTSDMTVPSFRCVTDQKALDAEEIILSSDTDTASVIDFAAKAQLNSGFEKDIIEIDDASNDNDDLRQYILPTFIPDVDTLKDKLLQDFGVNKLDNEHELPTPLNDMNVEQSSDVIEVRSSPLSLELDNNSSYDITTFSKNCKRSIRNVTTEMLKKCYVKLIRCDKSINTERQNIKLLESNLDIVETASNVSSRRGSFSILNEFPVLQTKEASELIVLKHGSSMEPGRTSPVMEIYDMLTNYVKCKENLIKIDCESEYFATKNHLHSLKKMQRNNPSDSSEVCELKIMKVPSLISLAALYFNNSKNVCAPIIRLKKLKRKLIATPSYAFTMKRSRKALALDSGSSAVAEKKINVTEHTEYTVSTSQSVMSLIEKNTGNQYQFYSDSKTDAESLTNLTAPPNDNRFLDKESKCEAENNNIDQKNCDENPVQNEGTRGQLSDNADLNISTINNEKSPETVNVFMDEMCGHLPDKNVQSFEDVKSRNTNIVSKNNEHNFENQTENRTTEGLDQGSSNTLGNKRNAGTIERHIVRNQDIELEVTFEDSDIENNEDHALLHVEDKKHNNNHNIKTLKELAHKVLALNNDKTKQTTSASEKTLENCDGDQTNDNYKQILNRLKSITSSHLESSSTDMSQQNMAIIYQNSNVILNGVLHEDPEIGTCFLFPYIENGNSGIDAEVLNATRDGLFEVIQEIDVDDDIINDDRFLNEEFSVVLPKLTYANKNLTDWTEFDKKGKRSMKRKLEMSEVRTSERKYRKGKNIDYPKLTTVGKKQPAYDKEFKRLLDYIDTVEFSYEIPFHKDYVDMDNLHFNWPIKGMCTIHDENELETSNHIFEDDPRKAIDPLENTLTDEINFKYHDEDYSFNEQTEIHFNMGFGEGSDRVIHYSGNGGSLSKFSAATLSDVKHSQPFLLFEHYEDLDCLKITNSKQDQSEKIKQLVKYVQLRENVRKFFEQTSLELNGAGKYLNAKDTQHLKNKQSKKCNLISELCKPDFIKPFPTETLVNVVQVGQLPVSTAAQNPVTCDPRVTQVSDASPSQCSIENSPRDDSQSGMKTEYTELTTADISLPLMQNYVEHSQDLPFEDSAGLLPQENIPVNTEIKVENSGTSADSNNKPDLLDLSITMKKDEIKSLENNISQDLCTNQINNIEYTFDVNNSLENGTDVQMLFKNTENETDAVTDNKHINGASEKTDQLAHAMNAAGITTTPESVTNNGAHTFVNILSQKIRQSTVTAGQVSPNNFTKTTSINAISLQQALAQILPPALNQATEGNQSNQNSSVGPQVLHIVQSKNGSGNQITLLDNSQQSVINNANAAPVLHIVQNKNGAPGVSNSGSTNVQQTNSYSGLSLVDASLQQGGNQLLHIVNTGNQKNGNSGQVLKRVNLLTNLTNVQGSNEQKMVQFVCKSADGKAIQLNAPHQRSMVLRLQPIETPTAQNTTPTKQTETQDQSASVNTGNSTSGTESSTQQEIKSRSVYEENYAKFIQNSSSKPSSLEKSTSLPKFNQAFGKPVFQDGNQKANELNTNTNSMPNISNNTPESNDTPSSENTMNMDQINQINSPPPIILQKSPAQTPQQPQTQPNLVQQIKQTIGPMNIQTMHGGVIYTRQIPVNIGGGQTINLITVPSTELIDDPNQKNQTDGVKFINHNEMEPSIIKIVPQPVNNTEGQSDDPNSQSRSGENTQNSQPQPVLTQMRIKLPMLSKAPHMVAGTRVVRPSFFQIQRNVIGGANQPVYQQLVLTTAPPLGQQTIRLPTQTQTQTRPVKLPSESQSSTESQMSSSTLEQLREFDMVLEQVKERSTVQPNGNSNSTFSGKIHTPSTDTTDGSVTSNTTDGQSVLYSIGVNQTANVAYVTRKASMTTPTTASFVRSPDSSGIADSASTNQISHSNTAHSDTSNEASQHKSKTSSKSKSRPKTSSNLPTAMKMNSVPPKPSAQKPLEDEQTTQRILYILAEYKEQVENSPDKDKPAPRRRSNPPANPPGSSKRKKSSSGSRRPGGRDMSPVLGEDTCRTMGSEDSSCGTSQGDCTENCLDSHSPQDSPRKVARKLTFEQDNATTTTPTTQQPRSQQQQHPQRNVIVADGQTITVARGTAGKPATAVLMPANYILPVSMVKGGQQIAIVTNRGPKLLTVGGGEAGTTNALLLQRLIGPAGLKPVLARPGVRHVRLPTAALHNLQAFNLASATAVQPPDSTAASATASQDPVENRVPNSSWTETHDSKLERGSSPDGSEPWNLPSSADNHDYSYEDVRADQLDRTVLDAIPDRYSPDMEAQRIFDKMFDTDSKKSYIVDSHGDSPRCAYDIDASDDDKAYQVVHKKDGTQHHRRLTHVSAAALRHKYAILEHELRLQKSLSEECEDLGVDSPSASELFPEAELLFAASPAQDVQRAHSPPPPQLTSIPQPDIDDQIATDQLLQQDHLDDRASDLDVNLGLDVDGEIQTPLDHEEFARSHPNTTFHSEPTDDVVVPPFTITELKARHITSTIFHSNRAPATVLMTAPQTTVISQATAEGAPLQNPVKYADLDNMIDSLPGPHTNSINLSSVLVKDDGLTRFDSILTDTRELHLTNTASAIVHATGNATQVIRRVCYDDKRRREPFLMDEPDALMGEDAKMVAEDSSRDATLESMADVDDDRSSPERHTELFWESNSASERSERGRPLDFSSDSDKCCKSPSLDETNSTDSSGVGTHMRLDSVIKEARGIERSCSADGSSADDAHPPLRTYPAAKRMYHTESDVERSLSGKTREGERSPDSLEVRRRASGRGVVKRGCHCCNGSPAPSRPKKPRPRKPNMEFN